MSQDDTLPTVALPSLDELQETENFADPRIPEPPSPASASAVSIREGAVYHEALHAEETARARGFALIAVGMCASGGIFSFVLGSGFDSFHLFASCAVLLGSMAAWTFWRARTEAAYTRNVFRCFGLTAAIVQLPMTYALGVVSPMPVIVTLGIIFFGLGSDRVYAIAIPIVATVGYAILGALIVTEVIPDLGLIQSYGLPRVAKAFFIFHVPLAYLVALWFARVSRGTMIGAIEHANQALLLANQREIQLDEAREDLERVLRAGAAQEGVYSGTKAGNYELAEVIGRGGMGDVYAAADATTGHRVAVKILRAEVAHQPTALERFMREGKLTSKLSSPHIVKVLSVGRLNKSVPYIIMELLKGEDLASKLRRDPRLEPELVVDLISQIARGLSEAHAMGIVHRDIKPQNLFESKEPDTKIGTWKVLDFGVSKLQSSTHSLTRQAIIGTPAYMSPEQARSARVDQRSDIFSLGSVVYRTLTGTPPFRGKDLPALLFDIVYTKPRRPSLVVPKLPGGFDRVLAIAMSKDPNHRFDNASTFAEALLAAHAGRLSPALWARGDAEIARREAR